MKLCLVIGLFDVLIGLCFQGGNEAEEEVMHGCRRYREIEAFFFAFSEMVTDEFQSGVVAAYCC
jgi:hypothetical protein